MYRYFKFHACSSRPRCTLGRRQELLPGDREDYLSTRDLCLAGVGSGSRGEFQCEHCQWVCYEEQCYKEHVKECKTKRYCGECGMVYKEVKGRTHM